jgi:dihydrodipicolinate synthase/N-acetylneuraminate lyase
MEWRGVFAAITTPFDERLLLEQSAMESHVRWLVDSGCHGIVPLGSLGEASTLCTAEKTAILATCLGAAAGRVPVVAGIAGLSTAEAVELARAAEREGCDGLMVLPPYVYRGDARETETHVEAVIAATRLPCMLYNNPIAYGVDIAPERVAAVARRHPNLAAIKESSGDIRRITELRRLLGDRLAVFAGIDDLILEALDAGAVGWVAGLVDALPEESLRLYDLAIAGERDQARTLYEWFLPLLRLDTGPKFVQLIKLVQTEVGRGSPRVRPPRLELEGQELRDALALIRACLAA